MTRLRIMFFSYPYAAVASSSRKGSRRSNIRISCGDDHSPPRAVGMPCSLRPAAMALRLVFPAACSSLMMGARSEPSQRCDAVLPQQTVCERALGSCTLPSFDVALWRLCCLPSSAASLPPPLGSGQASSPGQTSTRSSQWVELGPLTLPKTYPGRAAS
jgi:hypothetical protein